MKFFGVLWYDTHSGTNLYAFNKLEDAVKFVCDGIKEVYIKHGYTDYCLRDLSNLHDPNLCMVVNSAGEIWDITIGAYEIK